MAEILHQLIGSLSRFFKGFIHHGWLFWISSINSMRISSRFTTFATKVSLGAPWLLPVANLSGGRRADWWSHDRISLETKSQNPLNNNLWYPYAFKHWYIYIFTDIHIYNGIYTYILKLYLYMLMKQIFNIWYIYIFKYLWILIHLGLYTYIYIQYFHPYLNPYIHHHTSIF